MTVSAPRRAPTHATWTIRRPLVPIEGESLDGFIARVAAHNMLENALAITSLGGVIYGHRPDLSLNGWDSLHAVAKCLKVGPRDLQGRSYPPTEDERDFRLFFGTPVERRHLEIRTRRFSPSALRLSAHHRALWQLRLLPFCSETWEYLLDRCPRCYSVQRWYRTNGIERCDFCVEDLRRAPAELVPVEQREGCRGAVELLHPHPDRKKAALASLPPLVRELGNDGAIALLVRLFSLVDHTFPLRGAAASISWGAPPRQITAALHQAWTLLAGWPGDAITFMNKRIQGARGAYTDGNHGRSVGFLKRAAECPHREAGAAIASLRERLDLDGPSGPVIRSRTIDIPSLTRILGRSASRLADIRQKGGLPPVFCLVNGGAAARYDGAEIAVIRQGYEQRLSFERAGSLLGISYHGIEQLSLMGFLPAIPHPYFAICYGGPQTTLKAFQNLCRSIENRAARGVPDPVPLRRASMAIGGRLKPWGPIFEALRVGSIPYALAPEPQPLSQRILIPNEATSLLSTLRFEKSDFPEFEFVDSMTGRDAGEALNLQHKEYTPLVKTYVTPGRNGERIIPVSDVEVFAADLIGSTEVALRLGLSSGSAFHRLRRLGVAAETSFLWPRQSVERLLFTNSGS